MPLTGSGPEQITATLAELAERARGLTAGGRAMLGITGAPGAGKSTLAAALVSALGSEAIALPMDGFHLANEVLIDLGRRDRKGAPDTFDVGGYISALARARARQEAVVYVPHFDRSIETAIAGAIPIPADIPIVVTEGNYLLHESDGWAGVRPHLDEVWFIELDDAERRRRLVGRRMSSGESEADAAAWVENVDESNARAVTPQAARADVVITVVGISPTGIR